MAPELELAPATPLEKVLRSPVLMSVLCAAVVGLLILLGTGGDPIASASAVISGSLGPDGIGSTLSSGTPVIGLAVALAIPLRAGLVNLGGDGQMVLGGIAAVSVGLYSPLPAVPTVVLALLASVVAGAAYAGVAAVCENRFGVPLLVSSLLLGYPAVSLASYLARYPLKDPASSLPETRQLPEGVKLPAFGDSGVTLGLVLIVLVAAALIFTDSRTAVGYEIRMTGRNPRFAGYAGIDRQRLTLRLMLTSGGIAGLVGGIGVLGFPYRFTDGQLTAGGNTWTALTAALLASAVPFGTVVAAFFFAALSVGGLNMERVTEVPRQLTQILQALVIIFLAARLTLPRGRGGRRRKTADVPAPRSSTPEEA